MEKSFAFLFKHGRWWCKHGEREWEDGRHREKREARQWGRGGGEREGMSERMGDGKRGEGGRRVCTERVNETYRSGCVWERPIGESVWLGASKCSVCLLPDCRNRQHKNPIISTHERRIYTPGHNTEPPSSIRMHHLLVMPYYIVHVGHTFTPRDWIQVNVYHIMLPIHSWCYSDFQV